MFENIKWVFFDLGSTLVDEHKVYDHIFRDMAEQTGLDPDFLRNEAETLYRNHQKGDIGLCERYHLPKRKWYLEDENLYPAAPKCLDILHRHYQLGIIANQALGTKERLEKWGILSHFDLVIASAEVGIAKPDPEIFQLALDRADCCPQEAVMVGDRVDNDIMPAKEIGMATIWVRQGFGGLWEIRSGEETADCTVDNIMEICGCL